MYRKGKRKRTLKRELKELEIVEREAIANPARGDSYNNLIPLLVSIRDKSERGSPLFLRVKWQRLKKKNREGGEKFFSFYFFFFFMLPFSNKSNLLLPPFIFNLI